MDGSKAGTVDEAVDQIRWRNVGFTPIKQSHPVFDSKGCWKAAKDFPAAYRLDF